MFLKIKLDDCFISLERKNGRLTCKKKKGDKLDFVKKTHKKKRDTSECSRTKLQSHSRVLVVFMPLDFLVLFGVNNFPQTKKRRKREIVENKFNMSIGATF